MTKALCTDATCSAVSLTSTDKLHERLLRTLQVVDRILVESRACHPALLRRAHGSYASRFAEADGNRTRLSRATAHTGFEAARGTSPAVSRRPCLPWSTAGSTRDWVGEPDSRTSLSRCVGLQK